jgi:hypothetical protein
VSIKSGQPHQKWSMIPIAMCRADGYTEEDTIRFSTIVYT